VKSSGHKTLHSPTVTSSDNHQPFDSYPVKGSAASLGDADVKPPQSVTVNANESTIQPATQTVQPTPHPIEQPSSQLSNERPPPLEAQRTNQPLPQPAAPPHRQTAAAKNKKPHQSKVEKAPRKMPGSLGELVAEYCSGKGHFPSLPEAAVRRMAANGWNSTEERSEAVKLVASNRLLEWQRGLLVAAIKQGWPTLAPILIDLARDALKQHPTFMRVLLPELFASEDSMPNLGVSLRKLGAIDAQKILASDADAPPDKKACALWKRNASHCLILLAHFRRAETPESILPRLLEMQWKDMPFKDASSARRMLALLESQDDATAIAYLTLRDSEERASKAAQEMQRRAERAEQALAGKHKEFAERSSTLNAQIESLKAELESIQAFHTDELNQLRSDQARAFTLAENRRRSVIGRLGDVLPLLEDGLTALQREPPKVEVMLDYGERAVIGLRKELEKLEGGTSS
jgi:hypothetical protein